VPPKRSNISDKLGQLTGGGRLQLSGDGGRHANQKGSPVSNLNWGRFKITAARIAFTVRNGCVRLSFRQRKSPNMWSISDAHLSK
jgi:hypothetical protein